MVKQQTIFCQEYQRENQEVRRLPKRVFDPFGPVFVDRLVVQHSERDYYSTENGFHRIGSEQARYYHTQTACIMAQHQHFKPSMLQLHADVTIDGLQASHLRQHLSMEVSPEV